MNKTSGTKEFYAKEIQEVETQPGCWNTLKIGIFNKNDEQIGEYDRNYTTLFKTFYPFQLKDQWYALYSSDYTATRVMTLPDCKDICGEERNGFGFCPTHYYVPDLTNEDLAYEYTKNKEKAKWPIGSFGFMAGCVWGDDSSWKIQFLDLRNIPESFVRDDRFGYICMPGGAKSLKDCIDFDCFEADRPCVYISAECLYTFETPEEKKEREKRDRKFLKANSRNVLNPLNWFKGGK